MKSAKFTALWLLVLVPLGWGVFETAKRALQLF
jgi:hypothetical protein